MFELQPQQWPVCVGLARSKGWLVEYWNDQTLRPVAWYYRFLPFSWIKYNRQGVYVIWPTKSSATVVDRRHKT